jgi:hypothetical protein
MRTRIDQTSRRTKGALTYAVSLVVSQRSNGINLAEAVQFAAKYHNVTCAAIEAELFKERAKACKMKVTTT